MTLRHMRIFIEVCRRGSVTAAAEALYLAQPSVSLAIKELEQYYGIKLFDRLSRSMRLTEEGRRMFPYANSLVSVFDEMEQGVKNWDSFGTLRVGSSITIGNFLLPGLVKEFYSSHPEMKVQVQIDNSEQVEKGVLRGDLDFALIEGTAHSGAIVCERFMSDTLAVVCGKTHPLADKENITLKELLRYDLLLREHGSGGRELFDSMLVTYDVSAAPVWESTSTGALIAAVAAGLGVSVLPQMLVKPHLDGGELHLLKLVGIPLERRFYLIYHQRKFLSKSAQDFIVLAKNAQKSW